MSGPMCGGGRAVLAVALAVGLGLARPAAAQQAEQRRLDTAEFCQGLLDRGLTELFDFFLQQHRPADAIEAALLQRLQQLRLYSDDSREVSTRLAALDKAIAILRSLIAEHPDDPRNPRWRLQLGCDLLYKRAEPYRNNVLYAGATQQDRAELLKLARQASGIFEQLLADLKDRQQGRPSSAPGRPTGQARPAALADLRALRARAEYFDAWARLYMALAMPARDQRRIDLLAAVTSFVKTSRYAERPHDETGVQCQSLLLAGMAYRALGQDKLASSFLQRAISSLGRLTDRTEQRRLQWVANLARLEQIRLLRDAGRLGEALEAIAETRHWLKLAGPGDGPALKLTLALLESSVLEAQAASSNYPAGAAELRRRARQVLIDLARKQPALRDMLYSVIYRQLGRVSNPGDLDGFEKSVLVAGLMSQKKFDRAAEVARLLLQEDSPLARQLHAEALFNLAVCQFELGDRLSAMGHLADLAEQYPKFSRAKDAALYAVQIGAELFADPALRRRQDVRQGYLRALQVLMARFGQSDEARRWQFELASLLQAMGQYERAAAVYARVGRDDQRYVDAQYWRIFCLFQQARRRAAGGVQDDRDLRRQFRHVAVLARQFSQLVGQKLGQAVGPTRRRQLQELAAKALLMAASALADPPVNDPQAALDLLDDFGGYFGRSGRLAGQALKIRIGALQALGRFDEADALIEQLLQTDPTGAGAVMASLLEAMLQGPGQAAKGLPEGRPAAERTVRLAERLVDWAAAHSAQVLPEDALGLRLQLAKAYQQAGKLDKALEVFNQCLRRDAELNRQRGRQPEPTNSAVLAGQAECLYQLGRYRQALEVFQRQLYERAEPYSAIWWRAYLRSLQCHAALHASPRTAEQRQQARQVLGRILQSITARRQIDPQMGGAELASQFDQLERKVAAQLSALSPQAERPAAGTGSQD